MGKERGAAQSSSGGSRRAQRAPARRQRRVLEAWMPRTIVVALVCGCAVLPDLAHVAATEPQKAPNVLCVLPPNGYPLHLFPSLYV